MSYWNCDNPREHKRQGEKDFERKGRYGYDAQKYNDYWGDCSKAYRDGFDEARREQDRRDEQREEEEAAKRAAERRRHEQAEQQQYQMEQAQYEQELRRQEYEQEHQQGEV